MLIKTFTTLIVIIHLSVTHIDGEVVNRPDVFKPENANITIGLMLERSAILDFPFSINRIQGLVNIAINKTREMLGHVANIVRISFMFVCFFMPPFEEVGAYFLAYVCLSVCLSVRPSVRPYVRPSVRSSVRPSVCLSMFKRIHLTSWNLLIVKQLGIHLIPIQQVTWGKLFLFNNMNLFIIGSQSPLSILFF